MDKSSSQISVSYPGVCDTGDQIPDYMAVAYVKAIEDYIPEYLRDYMTLRYMVIGGRATNEHSKKKVLSADWDIVVEFVSHSNQEPVTQAADLVSNINDFITLKFAREYASIHSIINVKSESKDFGGHFLFQIGIVDPYTGRDFKFVDIHMCHDSSIQGVGNYCNYLDRAIKVNGITYAPLVYLRQELVGVEKNRRINSQKTANLFNTDFSGDMEMMRGAIIDIIEDMKDLLEDEELSKSEKLEKLEIEIESLSEKFDSYANYCTSKLSYWILTYKEHIKHARTKDRLENLS